MDQDKVAKMYADLRRESMVIRLSHYALIVTDQIIVNIDDSLGNWQCSYHSKAYRVCHSIG